MGEQKPGPMYNASLTSLFTIGFKNKDRLNRPSPLRTCQHVDVWKAIDLIDLQTIIISIVKVLRLGYQIYKITYLTTEVCLYESVGFNKNSVHISMSSAP